MPQISVIIPIYNREKSILNAIQSVLDQDFDDFEVIAVDDGSTDSSCEIVESIQDSRVKLIRLERNQGAQAARNVGIKAADSPWITFLDSDDVYLPHSLISRYQLTLVCNVKVIHSDFLIIKTNWKKAKIFGAAPLTGMVYSDLLRKPGPMFQSLFVAKEALVKIGFLDQQILAYQEWDTSIRLAKEYEFAFLPKPTYIYHSNTLNAISRNLDQNAKAYLNIVKKYEIEIRNHIGEKGLADHYISASILFYKDGNLNAAKLYLNHALKKNKLSIKANLLFIMYHLGIKIPRR